MKTVQILANQQVSGLTHQLVQISKFRANKALKWITVVSLTEWPDGQTLANCTKCGRLVDCKHVSTARKALQPSASTVFAA